VATGLVGPRAARAAISDELRDGLHERSRFGSGAASTGWWRCARRWPSSVRLR
jgi:hypothetical protein